MIPIEHKKRLASYPLKLGEILCINEYLKFLERSANFHNLSPASPDRFWPSDYDLKAILLGKE